MPFVKANDISLYFETYGDDLNAPHLFLVGGYTQHSGAWQSLFAPLSKHFQVIAFDNRGVGQTEAPNEPYSIEMFARDTSALMDELKIESAHFMGQSMGTAIIQRLCLDHPEKVQKAILAAPFSYLPPTSRHNGQMLLQMLQEGFDRKLVLRLNASWLLSNRFIEQPGNLDQFVDKIMKDPYPQSIEGLLGQADALFSCDLRSEIEKIPHNILLLAGEKDIDTPLYCAEFMNEKLKNSSLHVFKDMGHMFPYEIPEAVSKKAVQFLLDQ